MNYLQGFTSITTSYE